MSDCLTVSIYYVSVTEIIRCCVLHQTVLNICCYDWSNQFITFPSRKSIISVTEMLSLFDPNNSLRFRHGNHSLQSLKCYSCCVQKMYYVSVTDIIYLLLGITLTIYYVLYHQVSHESWYFNRFVSPIHCFYSLIISP